MTAETKTRWRVDDLGRTVEREDGTKSFATVGPIVARDLADYLNALEEAAEVLEDTVACIKDGTRCDLCQLDHGHTSDCPMLPSQATLSRLRELRGEPL